MEKLNQAETFFPNETNRKHTHTHTFTQIQREKLNITNFMRNVFQSNKSALIIHGNVLSACQHRHNHYAT